MLVIKLEPTKTCLKIRKLKKKQWNCKVVLLKCIENKKSLDSSISSQVY